MPIIARDNRREFVPAPEGLHQGVCVDVIDLGLLPTPWGEKQKVELRWQLDQTREDGGRHMVTKRYTLSLNEKAVLRQHLEAWRGKRFSREELEGFDLEKLLGINCQLQVVHELSDQGRTFANVQAIVPLGKGMVKLRPEGYTRMIDRTPANGHAAEPGSTDPSEDAVPF